MKRLLDIEFHKFRHSKSSKALTIIYLIIVVLLMLTGLIRININSFSGGLSDLGIFNFPIVWHISTYFTSYLKIFIAIVIVSLTASEYSNRTLKQNLIDGLSKKELILSKVYLSALLALSVTIVVFIAALILGLIYSDYNEIQIILTDLYFFPIFFLSHFVLFCFCLFAGLLIKRSAFALGFIGVWWIVEGVLNLVARGLDYKYDLNTFEWLSHILPFNAISNLIKNPTGRIDLIKNTVNQIDNNLLDFSYNIEWPDVVSVCIWSLLFIYWSYALLKKRDL